MNVSVFIRSHVERRLAEMLRVCRVPADQDGDNFFRSGTAACYVRVDDQDPVIVRVLAIGATGVSRSAKLLAEINEVNTRSGTARQGGRLTRLSSRRR
jgi:hypothetical protein